MIRWIEESDPAAAGALKLLYPKSGRAHIVGVTGPPGAGKSTVVDGMIGVLRARGLSVGVLAVDPTSPFSGGALLGDRVRMQRHATDPEVFIRSMATRGWLGGLARAAFEATLVLDAMGYDAVLVETVGVGQDEIEIVELAHTTVVLNVPGLGDGVQALKAGILEVADVLVVNKADQPGADEAERQLSAMLEMRRTPADGWMPPLLRVSATQAKGLEELADACARHRDHLAAGGAWAKLSERRHFHLFRELLRRAAAEALLEAAEREPESKRLVEQVRNRAVDPYSAVDQLLARLGPRGEDRG